MLTSVIEGVFGAWIRCALKISPPVAIFVDVPAG
jgi:hypothetical protein